MAKGSELLHWMERRRGAEDFPPSDINLPEVESI